MGLDIVVNLYAEEEEEKHNSFLFLIAKTRTKQGKHLSYGSFVECAEANANGKDRQALSNKVKAIKERDMFLNFDEEKQ